MTSVIANIQGGLGNQCFIYAAARALSITTGSDLRLNLDYLLEDRVYRRSLALDRFRCAVKLEPVSSKLSRMAKRLRYKLLCHTFGRIGNSVLDRRPFRYVPFPMVWHGDLVLDGYWQSEKYFFNSREQVLRDFRLKDEAWIVNDPVAREIERSDNPVFIHVRSYKEVPGNRNGDCVLRMFDYYQRAVREMSRRVKAPDYYVFSDDLELARSMFHRIGAGECVKFVEPTEDVVVESQIRDFTLMRKCRHGIVADSSFSWWAGWLGEQEWIRRGGQPIRMRVNRRVMNDDYWPERWVAI